MTEDKIRDLYAGWIFAVSIWAGAMTTGTILLIGVSAFGGTNPVLNAASMSIGQLLAGLAGYPYWDTSRTRAGMSKLPFRTHAIRMSAIAVGLFALLLLLGSRPM